MGNVQTSKEKPLTTDKQHYILKQIKINTAKTSISEIYFYVCIFKGLHVELNYIILTIFYSIVLHCIEECSTETDQSKHRF